MEKYKEPKYEIKRIWQSRGRRVNSIGIGALGTVSAGMPESQSEFPYKTKLFFWELQEFKEKCLRSESWKVT